MSLKAVTSAVASERGRVSELHICVSPSKHTGLQRFSCNTVFHTTLYPWLAIGGYLWFSFLFSLKALKCKRFVLKWLLFIDDQFLFKFLINYWFHFFPLEPMFSSLRCSDAKQTSQISGDRPDVCHKCSFYIGQYRENNWINFN